MTELGCPFRNCVTYIFASLCLFLPTSVFFSFLLFVAETEVIGVPKRVQFCHPSPLNHLACHGEDWLWGMGARQILWIISTLWPLGCAAKLTGEVIEEFHKDI